jgi:rhodanese-related sulfurtransferase
MKHFIKTFFLLLASCTAFGQDKGVLKANDFEKAIQVKGVQLLDVRKPDEYKEGHVKGAVLANWHDTTQFREQAALLDKKKPVYLYCLAGVRSAKAAEYLKAQGFTQVIGLDGGIKAWKEAGKPVEN